MAKHVRLEEPMDEINIMPLMNIIMLLIPFLIMSTEFIKIGVINVTAPKMGRSAETPEETPNKPKKPPLNLTVSVTDKGLTLITRGNKIPDGCDISKGAVNNPNKKLPTIKKEAKDYNYLSFQECLGKIKKLFSHEKRIIIMAEPSVKYSTIIKIMDGSRGNKDYVYDLAKGKEGLFPEVVLSAGVI